MNGFIHSYSERTGNVTMGPEIMRCFSPNHVPIISQLAKEYAVFDGWFAGVPGPTLPNRAFAASASSHGMGLSDWQLILRGMPQKTMFRQLLDMGLDYRVYFQSIPAVLMFKDMRDREARSRYSKYAQLKEDLKAGNMPEFTFIEPNYFVLPDYPANDQHPNHDVWLGEKIIQDVYQAVRSSPLWEKTALIITYDEHGGFFDHVPPPINVPSPDGMVNEAEIFDFTRLGIRVPTVVVSPHVRAGSVIHAPPAGEGQYEHSSFPATVVHKMFAPAEGFKEQDYLTKRDAWAATFEHIFDNDLRTDCPTTLPALFKPSAPAKVTPDSLVTDLQIDLLGVVAGAAEDKEWDPLAAAKWNQVQAAVYFNEKLAAFFGEDLVEVI